MVATNKSTKSENLPFACSECDYRARFASGLAYHRLSHTGERPFSCYLCNFKAKSRSSLTNHQLSHTGERPYACSFCSFRGKSHSALAYHGRIHTGERPYSCSQCKFTTKSHTSLVNHKLSHTGETPYSCTSCDFQTKYHASLVYHMKKIHKPEPNSNGKASLLKGKRPHNKKEPYSCDTCNFKGKSLAGLKLHQQRTHDKSSSDLAGRRIQPRRNPKLSAASTITTLPAVKASKKQMGQYSCTECSFASKSSAGLTLHMRAHTKTESSSSLPTPVTSLKPLSDTVKHPDSPPLSPELCLNLVEAVYTEVSQPAASSEIVQPNNQAPEQSSLGSPPVLKSEDPNGMKTTDLDEQILSQDNEIQYSCFCSFNASSISELSKHILTHDTPENLAESSPSDEQLPSKLTTTWINNLLTALNNTALLGASPEKTANSGDKETSGKRHFPCCICDFSSTDSTTLLNHVFTHLKSPRKTKSPEKSEATSIINSTFSETPKSFSHAHSSSIGKFHQCRHCDFKSPLISTIIYHERMHIGKP